MNDDIFRPGGGDGWERDEPSWSSDVVPVDATPSDGFAVDGTDAFAIEERPVDGPGEPSPATDGPGNGRSRAVVYTGAAIVGLLIVIVIGSSTGPRPVVGSEAGELRSESVDDTSPTTTDELDDVDVDVTGVFLAVPDEWLDGADAPRQGKRSSADDELDEYAPYDDEYADAPVDTAVEDSDTFDFDDEEFDFDTDSLDESDLFDLPSSSGRRTVLPRRLPVITAPRPRVTLPRSTVATTAATTSPTVADTATTTLPEDTTTSSTTTSTSTTTTTTTTSTTLPPAAPQWTADVTGLPGTCVGTLRAWPASGGLVASVAGLGLFVHPATGSWTGPVTATIGVGDQRAFVQDPAVATTFWIGGPDGVFTTTDGGATFTELGALTDVRSLSVSGSTLLAVTGDRTVSRYDAALDTWDPVDMAAVPTDVVIHEVRLVDDVTALVATDDGVYRGTAGAWSRVSRELVVGTPVRSADGSFTWLLTAGRGVLRSTGDGATWTSTPSSGVIDPVANSLALSADGELTTVGVGKLVRSADGGATWTPFGATLPFVPAGVARTIADDASVIWSATCGPSSVQRLEDPAT